MIPDPAAEEFENAIFDAIDDAEEILNPLEGLAHRAASDPGAPFRPEALEELAALKKENLAAYEALRARLKKAGCRVTALDDAVAQANGDPGGRPPKQADILIDLAHAAELSAPPTGRASPTSISTATARLGRFAPRAFVAGWPGVSSRTWAGRPVRRPCYQR